MSELANRPVSPRSVAFLLFDGVQTLDVCGPLVAFAQAEQLRPGSCALNCVGAGHRIRTSAGLTVEAADARAVDLQHLDTVVVPGGGASALGHAMQNRPLMHWIAQAVARIIWPRPIPRSVSTPTPSLSRTAAFGHRPGSRPASIWPWRWPWRWCGAIFWAPTSRWVCVATLSCR